MVDLGIGHYLPYNVDAAPTVTAWGRRTGVCTFLRDLSHFCHSYGGFWMSDMVLTVVILCLSGWLK